MADTTIDTVSASSDFLFDAGYVFYATPLIGAFFYVDANQDLAYKRTTDGGTSVGSATVLRAGTITGFSAWYDALNPASTNAKAYLVACDDAADAFVFVDFDVATGVAGTPVVIQATASIGTASSNRCFIVGSRNGTLVAGYAVAAVNNAYISTDGGTTWTPTTAGYDDVTGDRAAGAACDTGNDSDVMLIYHDVSADELTTKVLSGSTWTETLISTGIVESGVITRTWDCTTRRSDGATLIATWNTPDNAAGDILTFEIVATSTTPTVTAKTNVITNTAESAGAIITVDFATNDVYVTSLIGGTFAGSVQVRYYKSTDSMATWSGATNYSTGSANYRYLAPQVSHTNGGRFQPMFFNDTTSQMIFNLDNDIAFAAAAALAVVLTGTLTPTATEDSVATGGLTLVATISGTIWDMDIDNDDTESEDWISALVSAGAEALGWNNIVVGKFYRKEVLADSPLNYLRLGGNVTDQGSAGANGTPTALTVGAALLLSSAQPSSVFNAPTAKVALSSPAALDNLWDAGGTAEIVLRPWASGFSLDQSKLYSKIDGGAGWELIIDNQAGGYVDVSLRVDFSTQQGVWKVAGKIPIGIQTHLAVTYNADSTSNDPIFYINGAVYTPVEETTPSGTRSSDASSNLWIGSNSSVALTFNGELQESALYATSLSAARIQAHVIAASYAYGLSYADLARTSSTVITLTMPAFPFYDITVSETITATFPATTNNAMAVLVATPTFTITPTTRKTNFTPPVNPFNPNSQTPGPFGNVNGGLGPAAGDAFRVLGAGDQWTIGIPQMSVGLAGSTSPRVLLIRATEITEVDGS